MLNEAEAQQIENYINNRIDKLATKYQSANLSISHGEIEKIELLAKELATTDLLHQNQIISALSSFGTVAIVPLVQAYYTHTRTQHGGYFVYHANVLRLTIAAALYDLGEYFELTDLLSSSHGHIKSEIKEALNQADDKVIQSLMSAISGPDQKTDLLYWAIRALGELQEMRAVPFLIVLLQYPEIDTRSAAADSLGKIGDYQAISALQVMEKTDKVQNTWKLTGSEVATRAIKNIQSQSL